MSLTTSAAKIAITRVNGGLTTEHYSSIPQMLEDVLSHSGEDTFKNFLLSSMPKLIELWRRGREHNAIADADCDSLLHQYELVSGCEMIAFERSRQMRVEGWTPEHDDLHKNCEMAMAATCYALHVAGAAQPSLTWPWDKEWWKPSDPIRDLVKAGALIAAEIDRLQRIEARKEERQG
jgi:hypothetical protein